MVFDGGRTEPLYEEYAESSDASVISTAINGWAGLDPRRAQAGDGA